MITVLNILKENEHTFSDRIKGLFFPYRIETELKRRGNISVYSLVYHRRRGDIRFDKIYEKCIGLNKVLLCDKNVNLFNTHFRRFESYGLQRRLMINYLCHILELAEISPDNLIISYYDPNGSHPSVLQELLEFTSDITVVTDMPAFYEKEAQRISDDNGAVIRVSNEISALYPCDILIAPDVIRKNIPTARSTLVFTVDRPYVPIKGNIIYRYPSDYPKELCELCPEGTELWYFMSAMYTICKQKQLGELVPDSCSDLYMTFSADMMIRQIRARCMFLSV